MDLVLSHHLSVLGEYRSLQKRGSAQAEHPRTLAKLYRSIAALYPVWVELSHEDSAMMLHAKFGPIATLYYEFFNEFVEGILHGKKQLVESKIRYELVKSSVAHLESSQRQALKVESLQTTGRITFVDEGVERYYGKHDKRVNPVQDLLYAQHHPFISRIMNKPNAVNDMVNSLLAMSCLVE